MSKLSTLANLKKKMKAAKLRIGDVASKNSDLSQDERDLNTAISGMKLMHSNAGNDYVRDIFDRSKAPYHWEKFDGPGTYGMATTMREFPYKYINRKNITNMLRDNICDGETGPKCADSIIKLLKGASFGDYIDASNGVSRFEKDFNTSTNFKTGLDVRLMNLEDRARSINKEGPWIDAIGGWDMPMSEQDALKALDFRYNNALETHFKQIGISPEQIKMDPILYSDDPDKYVREYARNVLEGNKTSLKELPPDNMTRKFIDNVRRELDMPPTHRK